jgi:hypothetical protein
VLRDELDALRERQQALWLGASRPGGLSDSLGRLDRVRRALAGASPVPTRPW